MLRTEVAFSFVGNVVAGVGTLLASVVFARALGADGRGLLALAILVPTLTSTVGRLGQETVNVTFAGTRPRDRSRLFLQSVLVTTIGGAVSGLVVVAFFALPISKEGGYARLPEGAVALAAGLAPVLVFSTVFPTLVRGVGRISASVVVQALQGVLLALFGFILVFPFALGVSGALWAHILCRVVVGSVCIWFLRDYASLRFGGLSRECLRESLRVGTLSAAATLSGFLVYRVDQAMLGYMASGSQLGFYVVAVGLAEQLRIVPNSVSFAFLPRLSNEFAEREGRTAQVFRLTFVFSALSMLAVGSVGPVVLVVLFGREFVSSIVPFLLLIPGVMFLGPTGILANDMLARGMAWPSVVTGYGALGLQVGLNLVLIPAWGIAGAALASSVSYAMTCLISARLYTRATGYRLATLVPRWGDATGAVEMVLGVVTTAWRRVRAVAGGGRGGAR